MTKINLTYNRINIQPKFSQWTEMNLSTEGDCHRVAESRELYDIERRFSDKDT